VGFYQLLEEGTAGCAAVIFVEDMHEYKVTDNNNGNKPIKLRLNDPVSYMEMIALENNAKLIITDSGGVQKKGYFF